mgnify:CR=1 FL=1
MLRYGFDNKVSQILKSHQIEDEKLKRALTDLFNEFERKILSRDFIEAITEHQEREKRRRQRIRG